MIASLCIPNAGQLLVRMSHRSSSHGPAVSVQPWRAWSRCDNVQDLVASCDAVACCLRRKAFSPGGRGACDARMVSCYGDSLLQLTSQYLKQTVLPSGGQTESWCPCAFVEQPRHAVSRTSCHPLMFFFVKPSQSRVGFS